MRILLIEDDARTASFIIKGLRQEGFAVDHAADGEEGLHFAKEIPFDAAIIDIMLPKLDGLSLIERLRTDQFTMPVIVLSARSSVEDRIKGLHVGADDYLMKPFAFSELLARIHALLRRAGTQSDPVNLTVADLRMDIVRRKVFRNEKEITPMLSRKIDLATPLDRMATLSPYKRCALVAVRGAAVAAILFPPRSPSTLFSRRPRVLLI